MGQARDNEDAGMLEFDGELACRYCGKEAVTIAFATWICLDCFEEARLDFQRIYEQVHKSPKGAIVE